MNAPAPAGETKMTVTPTMTYWADRQIFGTDVFVNPGSGIDPPRAVTLPLRLDLANHSPTGFEWGYGGSGPSQLALAILAHHFENVTGDKEAATIAAYDLCQEFKSDVIAHLPKTAWSMTTEQIAKYCIHVCADRGAHLIAEPAACKPPTPITCPNCGSREEYLRKAGATC